MWKQLFKYSVLRPREIIVISISISIFVVTLLFLNQLISARRIHLIRNEEKIINNALKNELSTTNTQRKEILASETFNNTIKNGDLLGILSLSQEEAKTRNIGSIVITDKNGFVLARSHLPTQRGDNIYLTTSWGRLISSGETVTSATKGSRTPIIFTSASPIVDNGVIN
ncbi:MAG: hypothetical protein WAV25_02980 [Minisyncoccia bacterium]